VAGRADRRGNLYPAKQRPEQKIDAAVALMLALGRAMAEDANEGDLTDFLRNPLIARRAVSEAAGRPPPAMDQSMESFRRETIRRSYSARSRAKAV
jgi:hypothetical protein